MSHVLLQVLDGLACQVCAGLCQTHAVLLPALAGLCAT